MRRVDEETGNYYYAARYYDPRLSIFISVDPMAESTMDAYGYCYQNPINLKDPTGMSAEEAAHVDPTLGYRIAAAAAAAAKRKKEGIEQHYEMDEIVIDGQKSSTKVDIRPYLLESTRLMGGSEEFDEAVINTYIETQDETAEMRWRCIAGTALMAEKMETGGMLGSSLMWGWGSQNYSRASKGISVIGPRATYRQFARKIGAKYLNVTDKGWSMRKNIKFLQEVVKRGDDVIFAGKYNPAKLDPKSVLAQEIRYLQKHGYSWTKDYSRLVKK